MHARADSIFSLSNHEICILTARDGERFSGQIATWILPATLVPDHQRVLAVLSPANHTEALIRASGRFVVNLLASDQYDLVPLFGLVSSRDIDKFDGMSLQYSRNGLPLIPDTCGWAECITVATLDGGDRMVYLADVVEQYVNPAKTPLRKIEAYAKQSPDILALLEEKNRKDGERDRASMKLFDHGK